MSKILFVCTGNINRSAAAALIEHEVSGTQTASCGTGKTATKHVKMAKKMRDALTEFGRKYGFSNEFFENIEAHRSQPITRELVAENDLIVCMGKVHRKRIAEQRLGVKAEDLYMFRYDGKDVSDPHFSNDPETFRAVVQEIYDVCIGVNA